MVLAKPIIEIKNAGLKFNQTDTAEHSNHHWIFRDLNLSIYPKESVALIGPSGAGKSSLLKIFSGLLRLTEGTCTRENVEIGMLFQKNALFDSMSVIENLLFPLKERKNITGKAAQALAKSALEAVGLGGSERLFPEELSGGMQKRLGIARALIIEPELILYDEPTAGLDPITSKKIADLIIDLKQKYQSTLVIVTNDMHRAYQLGDRIYLIANGKLFPGGSPNEIKLSQDPSIHQFISGSKVGPLTSQI